MRIIRFNITFALLVKGIVLLLGALSLAGMWAAVFADVGVTILAVLNSARILSKRT
jgi:Cd2+/Zn2+-exporting ATPase